MIKNLKIGLLIVGLVMFVGIGSANAANITYSADTTVYLSSLNINLTILSGSVATSVIVNTGTVVVIVPASGTFTITSADRLLTATGQSASSIINTICANPTLSRMTITAPASGAETITITPSASACSVIVTGAGRGVYIAPTPVVTTPPVVITPTIPTTITPTIISYNFGTQILKNGSRGEAVKELQRFLNANLNMSLVVDGILGPKTIAIVKQWQKDNGLVVDGLIGPKTKAMMNSLATEINSTLPTKVSYNFGTYILKNGSRGEAVKELQRFLNAKLNLGLVIDGALGPKTIAVVKQWQKDNGLVVDGLIGPKTKAMMNASVQ